MQAVFCTLMPLVSTIGYWAVVLVVTALLSLSGYAFTGQYFEKISDTHGVNHDVSYVFSRGLDKKRPIAQQIFLIYVPGDNLVRDFQTEKECIWEFTPPFLEKLMEQIPRAVLVRMCPNTTSKLVEKWIQQHAVELNDFSIAEEKLEARVNEVVHLLDLLIAGGADPRKIFLIGHSFGGWVALKSLRSYPLKMNSVVVSAPTSSQRVDLDKITYEYLLEKGACVNPKNALEHAVCQSSQERGQQLSRVLRKSSEIYQMNYKKQIMLFAEHKEQLPALIFAYPTDAYNTPDDLHWIKGVKGVELHTESCYLENGHETIYQDCFTQNNSQKIVDYITDKLSTDFEVV